MLKKLIMSEDNKEVMCCASCGIAEIDDVKLMPCDGCDLVRYCSDECQNNHNSEHEEDCKKRAAELREELLFKQPQSSHHGDCPICSLPLPLESKKSAMYMCCSKIICHGCNYANQDRENEMNFEQSCPFCRIPLPNTNEESVKRRMKRIEANDPVAIRFEGSEQYNNGDHRSAFNYWTKAAELGDALAHHMLADMYHEGHGVEKDRGIEIHHLEEAAIGGHSGSRYILGAYENFDGNIERAVKHWTISATQGDDDSIKELMQVFRDGYVSKEDLAVALRAHKAAADATKSPQREAAEVLKNYLR